MLATFAATRGGGAGAAFTLCVDGTRLATGVAPLYRSLAVPVIALERAIHRVPSSRSRFMKAFIRTLAAGAALLAADPLAAQTPDCRHGRADDSPMGVDVTLPVHPTRVAPMLNALLREQGYEVSSAPSGVGSWTVAPRFTWLPAVEQEDWHGDEHPGVLLALRTEPRGDSTAVAMTARALCRVPPRMGDRSLDRMVEIVSVSHFAAGISESLENLRMGGDDLLTPADQPRGSVQAPGELAGFAIVSRQDYEDPAMGTQVRYGRDELYVDIFIYPGVPVTTGCDAACAVSSAAEGFIGSLPGLVREGHYESMDVTADEPLRPSAGAPWAFGRHLTMSVRRQGRALESHYWLYSMPGYFLKVRSSYPASPGARAHVQRFVDELPGKMMTSSP
jgi:hypothetical protein